MALKYHRKSLEGLPEEVAKLYEQDEDGKGFTLNVSGAAPKSKVDEFRDRNVELMKQLEKFKDVDPAQYAELMETQRQLEEEELIKKGDVEKVVANRVKLVIEEHNKTLDGLQSKLGTANRRLETLQIDNAVRAAATKTGVSSMAVDDVLLRAKTVFGIDPESGNAIAKQNGEVMYGKDGVTPLSVTDWVGGLKKEAPHLFIPSQGGNPPSSGGASNQNAGDMSSLQKISAGLANR